MRAWVRSQDWATVIAFTCDVARRWRLTYSCGDIWAEGDKWRDSFYVPCGEE